MNSALKPPKHQVLPFLRRWLAMLEEEGTEILEIEMQNEIQPSDIVSWLPSGAHTLILRWQEHAFGIDPDVLAEELHFYDPYTHELIGKIIKIGETKE